MSFEKNVYKNNDSLENLGYTYREWDEEYRKVMSSGLSTGHISDWGGWHYYLELDIEGRDIRDETMAQLNADFKELKDDFTSFINYLKDVNGEVQLHKCCADKF